MLMGAALAVKAPLHIKAIWERSCYALSRSRNESFAIASALLALVFRSAIGGRSNAAADTHSIEG